MKDYTIILKPQITLIGIACRTSNAEDAGPKDIPAHWDRFYKENIFSKIPDKASDEVFALYCDYEGDYTKPYTLVIGCPVKSTRIIPQGMVAKTIPAGTYALYQAIGEHPQALVQTWSTIWQTPLNRTYSGDYEVYGKKFTSSAPQEVEVFIGLKP